MTQHIFSSSYPFSLEIHLFSGFALRSIIRFQVKYCIASIFPDLYQIQILYSPGIIADIIKPRLCFIVSGNVPSFFDIFIYLIRINNRRSRSRR